MLVIFASVPKQAITDFENGVMDNDKFVNLLLNTEQIGLNYIDRAIQILAKEDESSPYYDILGPSKSLTGGDGKPLDIDSVSFFTDDENEDELEPGEPPIYATNDSVKASCAIMADVDEAKFKEAFDFRVEKMLKENRSAKYKKTVKEFADDVFETLWNELNLLKILYEKTALDGNYIVVFSLYEEYDFEEYDFE